MIRSANPAGKVFPQHTLTTFGETLLSKSIAFIIRTLLFFRSRRNSKVFGTEIAMGVGDEIQQLNRRLGGRRRRRRKRKRRKYKRGKKETENKEKEGKEKWC